MEDKNKKKNTSSSGKETAAKKKTNTNSKNSKGKAQDKKSKMGPDTKNNKGKAKIENKKSKDELKKIETSDSADEKDAQDTEKRDNRKLLDKKKEKRRKILMYIGFVICAILLVTTIVSSVIVFRLDVVPMKYVVLIDIVILIFIVWMTIMQRWFVPGIVAKVIAVIMIVAMIIGSVYMNYTYKSLKKMTGNEEKIDQVCVYVLAEDEAQTLQDVKDYSFGVLSNIDQDNTANFKASIEKQIGKSLAVTEYDYVLDLVGALYNGEVQAIILNSAYGNFASSADDFKNFSEDTRIIYSEEIVSKVKVDKPKKEEYLADDEGEVFTIYVSGIDTRGSSPQVNSNSDVNILIAVNTKTRQILLLSTPRDYYVPLSISNGVKDKLTHAGGHGIDVSVDTLEMLYEINIDDYLKINFTGFIDVIDALGGVDVYSEYSFYTTHGGDYIDVGYNSCDGAKALGFARERYNVPGGDRTRGKNQMAVIEAVIKKLVSSQLLYNYTDILDSITDSMVTSMTYDEISDLVKFQLNDMRGWDIVKYSVDGYDSKGSTYSAGSQELYVMEPKQETVDKAKEYLRQIYAGQTVYITEDATTEASEY